MIHIFHSWMGWTDPFPATDGKIYQMRMCRICRKYILRLVGIIDATEGGRKK